MRVLASAQEVPTPTPASTPPPRVYPCRVAELRRGDRYAVADFLGQQRFRTGEDRRKNGRIFPESAHLIQARASDAEDRRGRSVDARSGAGDLHHLHDQRRRPETGRRRSRKPRAEQAKLKWLPYTSLLEFVAERFHSAEAYIQKLNPGKDLGTSSAGRNSQGAECLAVRSREIHRRKSS